MMRRAIIVAVGFVCVAAAYHAARIGFAYARLAQYRNLALTSPDPVGADDAAARASLLESSVGRNPADDQAWYERGRFAHRLVAATRDDIPRSALSAWFGVRNSGDRAAMDRRLLEEAIRSYDEAARRNRLDADSRFWRVFAEEALARRGALPPDNAQVAEWFDELDAAMRLDPQRPERWLEIGKLAMVYGRVEESLGHLRRSLDLSHEGLESAVETAWYSPAAMDGVMAIVPDRANARERLSRWLFDRWIFDESERAWRRSRELAALPISEGAELIANGDFRDDLGSHFHDWRAVEVDGVKVTRGTWALRVAMSRGPANWFHVTQDVPLDEGASYRLRAKLEVQGFDPRVKLGIEVVHPVSPDLFSAGDVCYVSAPPDHDVAKSAGGGPVTLSVEFTVPDDLPAIRVRLRRHGGAGETDSGKGVMIWSDVSLARIEDRNSANGPTGELPDASGIDHHPNAQ
ncbi:MAG: hypothetical protein IT350_11765 [Deltaproteobacteria bacterium]|nr:hypothetical protein [Deltaproteobacteria bacterium]